MRQDSGRKRQNDGRPVINAFVYIPETSEAERKRRDERRKRKQKKGR